MADTFPEPYPGELKGIANATGIPLGNTFAYLVIFLLLLFLSSWFVNDFNISFSKSVNYFLSEEYY